MSKIIYLTDRSRIVTREECPRKRYLNYDLPFPGAISDGIQRRTISLPLLNGIEGHNGFAHVLAGEDVDKVVNSLKTSYWETLNARGVFGAGDTLGLFREQVALLEGSLRGFVHVWLPRILEEYEVISIEQEHDWHLAPGLAQKLRFDVLLRRKSDGMLIILDWKTLAYISEAWEKKHEHSRQTNLYVQAAQEIYGEPVEIGYVGIVKGIRKRDTALSSPFVNQIVQYSPYCYAYALKGSVGNIYQSAYTQKKGYQKVRIYDEMSVKEWVEWLWHNERKTLNELFTFVPPFAPVPTERLRVKRLVVHEELDYIQKKEHYHEMLVKAEATGDEGMLQQAQDYFDYILAPMREENCMKYGPENICQFDGICHNEGALENIVEDPLYEPREAHHTEELEGAA